MKRVLSIIAMALCLCLCLTACTTSMSFTFTLDTGDNVKVKLNTTDGYKLSHENGNFHVSKDDANLLSGVFIIGDMYDDYETAMSEQGTLIESGDNYNFYAVEGESGTEHWYLVKLPTDNTALILGGNAGEENARTAYELLTFELVD